MIFMTWLTWFGSWISWEFLIGVAISFGILLLVYWVRLNFIKIIAWYTNWSRNFNNRAFEMGQKLGENYKNGTKFGDKYNGFKGNKVQPLPKQQSGKRENKEKS